MSPIEEYILNQEEEKQGMLYEVYHCIQSEMGECEEKIAWQMPTFRKKYNVIHFACMKKHIGIYPGPDAISHFEHVFKENKLKYSKGCVQIPYKQPLPLQLITDITKYCLEMESHT